MGTIKNLSSLHFSISNPAPIQGTCVSQTGSLIAPFSNPEMSEVKPASESNHQSPCPSLYPTSGLKEESNIHPVEAVSAPQPDSGQGCRSAEVAMDSSYNICHLELGGTCGEVPEIKASCLAAMEAEVKVKRALRVSVGSLDLERDTALTGCAPNTATAGESSRSKSQEPPNTAGMSETAEVELCGQPSDKAALIECRQEHKKENQVLASTTCSSEEDTSVTTSQDTEVQETFCIQRKSIATSPMTPVDKGQMFPIPEVNLEDRGNGKPSKCLMNISPSKTDVRMQVSTPAQSKSVATGPMTPVEKSPLFHIPESHVEDQGIGQPVTAPSRRDTVMQVSIPAHSKSVATDPMTPVEKSPMLPIPEVNSGDRCVGQPVTGLMNTSSSKRDVEMWVSIPAQSKSVATDPMTPVEKSPLFPIPQINLEDHGSGQPHKSLVNTTPSKRDVEMQVSIPPRSKSIATGPMTPVERSPLFPIPRNHLDDQGFGKPVTVSSRRDAEMQVAIPAHSKSVAIDPMTPVEKSTMFLFPENYSEDQGSGKPAACFMNTVLSKRDVEMQGSIPAQSKSVATGPMTPVEKSPLFPIPEVNLEDHGSGQPNKSCKATASSKRDVAMQVSIPALSTSVATGPMTPVEKSPLFPIPESHSEDQGPRKSGIGNTPSSTAASRRDVEIQVFIPPQSNSVATDPMTPLEKSPMFPIPEINLEDHGSGQTSKSLVNSAPSRRGIEMQVSISPQSKSVATDPMTPVEKSPTFPIQENYSEDQGIGQPVTAPSKRGVEMQVSIPPQSKSVATDPMTPLEKVSHVSLPEVHVEVREEEQPEPVREVQWDERGMTWDVYGASIDAEVLGLAIQKHLEKQIEEHGKQNTETCDNNKSSSLKGALRKEPKRRQSNVFQAVLHNIRSPQCCTRGNTTAE